MSNILERIVVSKQEEVRLARARLPEAELRARLGEASAPRGFRAALDHPGEMRVIAEIKKASPSAGLLCPDFDPVAIARQYEQHGASCISVLTDGPFFQGSLDDLRAVRAAVALPILRKDFLIDPYQVLEARVAGADAVLLIAEILDDQMLSTLLAQATELGMDVLVEIHESANLPRVLRAGATLVGINNRDLRTFVTSLEHTLDLAPTVPANVCLVSESGIRQRDEVLRLQAAGVRAILVGETLMRSGSIGATLDHLRGVSRE